MDRRSVLALNGGALAAITGLAGCTDALGTDPAGDDPTTDPAGDDPTTDPADGSPTADPSSELVNPSFEADWAGWTVGRDLPEDPNESGEQPVASAAGVSSFHASDGENCLELRIDGSQDDGTVWVQQPVDLSGVASLSVDYRVASGFNHLRSAAVYAGPDPDGPLTEEQMDTSRSLEGYNRDGWTTFSYDVSHDGPGVVAVGMTVVWETGVVGQLDDVRLSSDPPSTRTTAPPPTDEPTTSGSPTTGDGGGDGDAI